MLSDSTFELSRLNVKGDRGRGASILRADGQLTDISIEGVPEVGIQVTDPRADVRVTGGRITATGTSGIAINGSSAMVTLQNLAISQVERGEGDPEKAFMPMRPNFMLKPLHSSAIRVRGYWQSKVQ